MKPGSRMEREKVVVVHIRYAPATWAG